MRLSVKYIIDVINANPGLPHISRSNYYYQTYKPDKDSGNQKLMDRIKEIFLEHSRRYGYRRIYGQLRREGYEINHKKVQRLMQKIGLFYSPSQSARNANTAAITAFKARSSQT